MKPIIIILLNNTQGVRECSLLLDSQPTGGDCGERVNIGSSIVFNFVYEI